MGGFKLICSQCGSDKVLEKSSENKLDWIGDKAVYGEGIQIRCTECDNEEFMIFRTWTRRD
ncbi:MAG: hypothetical protein APF77_13225 [Clostridia bacterium BRH_c25]|nr:MAG: hypothetical protein APF77_13225 [Clostridia bacterium BRH_c25]